MNAYVYFKEFNQHKRLRINCSLKQFERAKENIERHNKCVGPCEECALKWLDVRCDTITGIHKVKPKMNAKISEGDTVRDILTDLSHTVRIGAEGSLFVDLGATGSTYMTDEGKLHASHKRPRFILVSSKAKEKDLIKEIEKLKHEKEELLKSISNLKKDIIWGRTDR